jgi:hypothetical protein
MLVTSKDGVVTGLGRLIRNIVDPLGWHADVRIPWAGYAAVDVKPESVDIWALFPNNEVCLLVEAEPIVPGVGRRRAENQRSREE